MLKKALFNLGFYTQEEMLSFLNIMNIAGYFSFDHISSALHALCIYNLKLLEHVISIINYKKYSEIFVEKFNSEYVLNNLFNNDKIIDIEDIEDLFFYLSQNAFARSLGQERDSLQDDLWMFEHKMLYLDNAYKLGLIQESKADRKDFDEAWLLGASFSSYEARLKHFKYNLKCGCQFSKIRVLTGQRVLSDSLDGKANIKFVKDSLSMSSDVLMETDMVAALHAKYLPNVDVEIINTGQNADGNRPTTITTAIDASKNLIDDLSLMNDSKGKEINIYSQSNQPHAKRQALANENTIKEYFKDKGIKASVKLYPVGPEISLENTSNVTVIHSELASLVSEHYKKYILITGMQGKRNIDSLFYQSRNLI